MLKFMDLYFSLQMGRSEFGKTASRVTRHASTNEPFSSSCSLSFPHVSKPQPLLLALTSRWRSCQQHLHRYRLLRSTKRRKHRDRSELGSITSKVKSSNSSARSTLRLSVSPQFQRDRTADQKWYSSAEKPSREIRIGEYSHHSEGTTC